MVYRGFGKYPSDRKARKINKIKKELEDSESWLQKAAFFGLLIQDAWTKDAKIIREKSEKEYGDTLINARLIIMCALFDILTFKGGIPGKTSDSISERLVLITVFAQGQIVTERLISEGQYVKASAALKQDIEIVARLCEILQSVSKNGKTPNVRYAPGNLNEHYGDMNDIAHISKADILSKISAVLTSNGIKGVSIRPLFHAEITKKLYELHINLCYIVLRQAIDLFREMYGDDEELLLPACKLLEAAIEQLGKAGWVFTNS